MNFIKCTLYSVIDVFNACIHCAVDLCLNLVHFDNFLFFSELGKNLLFIHLYEVSSQSNVTNVIKSQIIDLSLLLPLNNTLHR